MPQSFNLACSINQFLHSTLRCINGTGEVTAGGGGGGGGLIFPTYHKPIVFKDVFHTNKCYDHVMTGLLVLREMIKVVFSESKKTGYNSNHY